MGPDDPSRGWQPLTSLSSHADIMAALDDAIVRVRFAPQSPDTRRRLRALAALPAVREPAITVLKEEARKALIQEPAAAAVLLEVLVRTYESLDRPVEAIDAMEQLVVLTPDSVDHLLAFASRCATMGAWAKAAEAFERVGAVAGRDQACSALRTAVKLYREHSQPARAVEACRAILGHRPSDKEAWRDLEVLLEELGRWRELADVRGELAQRAASPVDKGARLRAQARALEQAGDVTAAAEVMAEATRYMADDVSGLLDYADVLARTGKGQEAADVLVKRIGEVIARAGAADEIAGLRARLAAVLEDACGDRAAAAAVLDQLLADSPGYLPALERAAAQASLDPDPRVRAFALERLAVAQEDPAAKLGAYAEAARRYRDAGDSDASVRAFELALEQAPDDVRLRDELEQVRAALDVKRASAEAAAGDVATAIARLRAILEVRPLDVDANLALADLLPVEQAREQLHRALANAPEDMSKLRLALLAHKYALVVQATGDIEEAHRLLHEAHLLDRHSLEITLALGESCYARKLWRQTVLYLAPLADHPDVTRFASRVADALVHAGQAEVRALRPANAMQHYANAVRLDPACPAAWHALGADALDRGNIDRAIECFEREASGTKDASERSRLFDALGDLARDTLGDPARAERYWSKIPEPDAGMLGKLLALQRERGADERADTCMRLAALDPQQHKLLMQEAAELYAAWGDFVRARAAAEQLIAKHPLDVDAVSCASEVVLAACDADAAAAWLHRALEAWHASRAPEPRQAELWRRLGDAERSRKRNTEARTAYERAVAIGGDSPDALAARRSLMELTPTSERTLESLEVLVEAQQSPAEVVALARLFVRADRADDARALFDLARALDAPRTAEDEQFLTQTAPKPMAFDEAYGGVLDDRHIIDDPADPPVGLILDVLGEALALLAPDPASALRAAEMGDASRMSVTSYAAAASLYPQVSKALAGPQTLLYTHDQPGDTAIVVLSSPPVIVIGSAMAQIKGTEADPNIDPLLRFKLGRVVELARPRRIFAMGMAPEAFVRLVEGVWSAFGPDHDTSSGEAKRIHGALAVQMRRRLGELLADVGRDALDPQAYVGACHRAADRSGLVACGNATVAIGACPEPHLIAFAASRGYRAARRSLRRLR